MKGEGEEEKELNDSVQYQAKHEYAHQICTQKPAR